MSPACLLRCQLISLGPETQRRACERMEGGISKGARTRGARKRKKKRNCFLRSNQETLQSLLSRSSSRALAPPTSRGLQWRHKEYILRSAQLRLNGVSQHSSSTPWKVLPDQWGNFEPLCVDQSRGNRHWGERVSGGDRGLKKSRRHWYRDTVAREPSRGWMLRS